MNQNGWHQDPATRELWSLNRRDFLIRASSAAVAVGGLVAGIPLTAHAAPALQPDWRFCGKCNGLFYSGANGCYYRGNQRCPAGDRHNPLGYNFRLLHDIEETPTAQKDWRFCTKCNGLFFSGANGSYYRENQRCPAGDLHNPDPAGYNYVLLHDLTYDLVRRLPGAPRWMTTAPLQRDWRFCTKCNGLFFSGANGSYYRENQRCPAGDLHNPAGYNFVLSHEPVFIRHLGRATTTACMLPPLAFTNVGLGLPNPSYKLPSVGYVRTVVLFADFSDVQASQTPQNVFAVISPNAEKFFADISYGRMCWTLEPHFTWLRLSQLSAHYAEAIRTGEGHQAFIQEAVTLADADVDFSTADSVVVMIPFEATAIRSGPAFGANPGQGYTADGKIFSNGLTSGADLRDWAARGAGFRWLNHESGHTMGLPDLYAFQAANEDDRHRFVGGFGLMGLIDGNAPEYFAFERWQLGWLDDNQIVCLPSGGETVTLTAIELAGGRKAVMVPRSRSRAVVVESRRRLGYDANLAKPGALVYVVDTSVRTGEGPLVIQPALENDPHRDRSPLGVGESITVEDVTIASLSDREDGDVVRVDVTK
jgi:M6 family metalloprotease-like protein